MKTLTGHQIRQLFLDYFKSKGHMIEPGASLVPINDPTLLWINSGVAALKKYFDGTEKPLSNRITNAQKSIRTNDIENVGKTARHHTFFEMLGNFSIGDYFKEEAIYFAWEFLTSSTWVGFDPNKLYITVYIDDTEAYRIWTEIIKVDPSHILKTAGNFWQIGEGPSGPDTEIFYDRGELYDPENMGERLFFEELDNERYVEIWNVVFSQYDAKEGVERKNFKELPQRNIDTGMGLERLVSIIQQGETNYDTDLFLPIIYATEKLSQHPYKNEYKMAYRVIADHIRTVTFALADGANFSNEGRGYVLRRVLRRAVRFGIKLGIKGAFMYNLVAIVAKNMEDFYPYLMEKINFIQTLVHKEEEIFHKTLAHGEKLLQEAMNGATNKTLSGETVFKLYDTFGFPKELTLEIAEEAGYQLDEAGFTSAMNEQKRRAKEARLGAESMQSQSVDLLNFKDSFEFLGYNSLKNTSKVTGLFSEGVTVESLDKSGDVIVEASCFYAESGGQIADIGMIYNEHFKAIVTDVKKTINGQHLHHINVIEGILSTKDVLILEVEATRRRRIMANHSSLHLLHSALKRIVGTHVNQAGSYVSEDYARFDFTHFEKVSAEQLKAIETMVNQEIFAQHTVTTEVMEIDDAKQSGAVALFDEKYTDSVRVVSMANFSKELCGGTHVSKTSDIGLFKIEFEESIGSGIRRIQSKTGFKAYEEYTQYLQTLETIQTVVDVKTVAMVQDKVINLVEEFKTVKKELARFEEKELNHLAEKYINDALLVDGLRKIVIQIEKMDAKQCKTLAEIIKNKAQDALVLVLGYTDESLSLVCASSPIALNKGYKAGHIVKEALAFVDGKGGGKDDMAQGGSKDRSNLKQVIDYLNQL